MRLLFKYNSNLQEFWGIDLSNVRSIGAESLSLLVIGVVFWEIREFFKN